MIWLILAILTLGALLYLCVPLYGAAEPEIVGEDIDAYRAESISAEDGQPAGFERQLLNRARAKPVKTGVPRGWLASVFIGSLVLTGALYHKLGRADLAGRDIPLIQAASPAASAQDAIAQMSPEDRMAMINNMVESLAARLREEPDNTEGWVRLLRSRQVLGQDASEDITLMRETYAEQPEVIADILLRSAGSPQP